MTARICISQRPGSFMVLLFFHFFSFGCHMEEGQNLSDFLLAMIPVKVPLIFETPSYYSRGKREAHLVILFWNIDSALLPKERCLCLLFSSSMFFCFVCLARIGGYLNQQTLTKQRTGIILCFILSLKSASTRTRPLMLLRLHDGPGERTYR